MLAKMASDARRGFQQVTTGVVMAAVTPLVSGGRYGDPTQTSELTAPLILCAIIFIGMLGLLYFFKRKYIKQKCYTVCCCLTQSRAEPQPIPNTNMINTITTANICEINCPRHEGPDSKVNKAIHQDQNQDGSQAQSGCILNRQELGHAFCLGCGAKLKDGEALKDGQTQPGSVTSNDTRVRNRGKRLWDFVTCKKTTTNSDPNRPSDILDASDYQCDNCFPMIYKRKALKQQDITHVGLTFETPETCHI